MAAAGSLHVSQSTALSSSVPFAPLLRFHNSFLPRKPSINPWRATISTPPLAQQTLSLAIRACSAPASRLNLPDLRHLIQTLAAATAKALVLRKAVFAALQQAVAKMKTPEHQPLEMEALSSLRSSLSCAVAPLCFAAISRSTVPVNTPLTVVASGMAKWLELYSGVLMVRVLLSWFPNIPWERQPLQAIRDMCDPYLNLFRNIIPPLFNVLDLSPLLAFLVLGLLASILNSSIHG